MIGNYVLPPTPVEHEEWTQLTPFGLLRGCGVCGAEVLGGTPLLLPCPGSPKVLARTAAE